MRPGQRRRGWGMILNIGEERGTQHSAAQKAGRFWEVDASRGVAIIMMVVYHTTYDLDALGGYGIDATSGNWALFADLTAGLFLFLVGVSLAISRARTSLTGWRLFGKHLARGLRILAYGMILTGVFLVFATGQYILAQNLIASGYWLLPFGVVPENVMMPDYRPLLPWFGVVLIGISFGNLVYTNGLRPAGRTQ